MFKRFERFQLTLFSVTIIIWLIFTAIPTFAILPPDASMIQVHDMQMIRQQQFRQEVLNDYNDVQKEKERYQKRNAPTIIKTEDFYTKPKMIEEQGEIKIKLEN